MSAPLQKSELLVQACELRRNSYTKFSPARPRRIRLVSLPVHPAGSGVPATQVSITQSCPTAVSLTCRCLTRVYQKDISIPCLIINCEQTDGVNIKAETGAINITINDAVYFLETYLK